jgi:hypothetical protein
MSGPSNIGSSSSLNPQNVTTQPVITFTRTPPIRALIRIYYKRSRPFSNRC